MEANETWHNVTWCRVDSLHQWNGGRESGWTMRLVNTRPTRRTNGHITSIRAAACYLLTDKVQDDIDDVIVRGWHLAGHSRTVRSFCLGSHSR